MMMRACQLLQQNALLQNAAVTNIIYVFVVRQGVQEGNQPSFI
jgi:hypothetical protein